MPTETLQTRSPVAQKQGLSAGFGVALGLHAAVVAVLVAAAYVTHFDTHWGDRDPTAGSIQASMVSAIPLPPKVAPVDKEVLATDNPSPAPTPPPPAPETKSKAETKPKTEPPPKPNEVLIPEKRVVTPKDAKPADKPQPEAPKHPPVTPPPPTPKATTGAAAAQIPMSITQMRNGTASISVDDRTFGDRYAYYIKLIGQKIAQSKAEGDQDPADAKGKKTTVRFVIQRDGSPMDVAVEARSGSLALDTSTLRAIQRIDTFGPLPAGSQIVVHLVIDAR
jgi:protein TonB